MADHVNDALSTGGPSPGTDETQTDVGSPALDTTEVSETLPNASAPVVDTGQGAAPLPDIDGFRVIANIRKGGQGLILKAVELAATGRTVAMKFPRAGAFTSDRGRALFENEVEKTARLEHPNIARVYRSGQHNGVPFYSMEWIDGVELHHFVRNTRLTQRELLGLMMAVCRAVQHAHQRGIVHRDLKPANVMVTTEGNEPKVLDFGLAVEDTDLLATIDRGIGTPLYMSPEQGAGQARQLTTQTDVYSLGVILYELLTGKHPNGFTKEELDTLSTHAVRQRIAEGEVTRPRHASRDMDGDLEALLLKALAHDPDLRYASAGQLAEDIENYLTGEPLSARKPTIPYFLSKRLRKYRIQVAVAALVLLGAVAGAVFYVVSVGIEKKKADDALIRELRQRGLAETSAGVAMTAVKSLVFEVQRKLKDSPEHDRLRKDLLEVAARGLREIADTAGPRTQVTNRSMAAAILQIGDIFKKAGQRRHALEAYDQALGLFRLVAERQAGAPRAKRDLCLAHMRLGDLLTGMERPDEAREHLQTAERALLDLEKAAEPGDLPLAKDRWALHVMMGDWELLAGDAEKGLRHFVQSVEAAGGIAGAGDGRELSISHNGVGKASLALGDADGAARAYSKALAIHREAHRRNPSLRAKQDLAMTLSSLGEATHRAGQIEQARRYYRESIEIHRELAGAGLDRFEITTARACTLFMLGKLEEADGSQAEAVRCYRQARDILRELEFGKKLIDMPKYLNLLKEMDQAIQKMTAATQPSR